MAATFEYPGATDYRMVMNDPHRELEALSDEIKAVDAALQALVGAHILAHTDYDDTLFLAHRAAVRASFEIPWTGITPRMQRLLYAINAIAQPDTMVAVGIFCGNTFISNAGAAVGPGACYQAARVVGIEIIEEDAQRAQRNVAAVDPEGRAEVLNADGIAWLKAFKGTVDLLYIDANTPDGDKGIYLDVVMAAAHALRPGSLVLAHNSYNSARTLADYLAYVRAPAHFTASMNVIIDDQGLEVSRR
jgi:predicted O-methyltransferase YrrM